jgi:hypothetical protein
MTDGDAGRSTAAFPKNIPRIGSEFQSRERKDSLSGGVVQRLVRRRGDIRAGLAVAFYLIANDATIAPAESAITSQNK